MSQSMTPSGTPPGAPAQKDHGRAGRDLPASIASAIVLLAAIAVSLAFWKTAFMFIVAAAVVVAVWELHRGLMAKDIDVPEQPLMIGGVVMVVVAYFFGAPALVTATAVSALVTMLWLLRRGVPGYVQNATASVFVLIYVPVPRLVRGPPAGRGRRLGLRPLGRRGQGRHRLHPRHHRLRHRRLHRGRAVRQAPDGAGHLAEEVVGGLRRLGASSASRSASAWSSGCSTATGGSASPSA